MAQRSLVIVDGPQVRGENEAAPRPSGLTELELQLLLEGVARLSGFDFRELAPAALRRRVSERMRAEGASTITGLLERVVHDPSALERLLFSVTATPPAPSRDLAMLGALARLVVPRLRTYPFFRIWLVGGANVCDPYELAILLREAGLTQRVRIYATEATDSALARTKAGILTSEEAQVVEERYRAVGGKQPFSTYVHAGEEGFRFDPSLAENVLFTRHYLAAEGAFNEFQAVVVRASLANFSRALAYQVHQTLHESVTRYGFLCVPGADTLATSPHRPSYEPLEGSHVAYRRIR